MPNNTVTIPKIDYEHLLKKAEKFELLTHFFNEHFFNEPTTTNINAIMRAFRKTGKYNEAFLKSFKRGLKESYYFKQRGI